MPDARSAPPPAAPERGGQTSGEHHGRKWKVEPSSTGRGAPPAQKPPMVPQNRRGMWLGLIAGFLVLNLILAFITGGPKDRTQVPYQPFFINQVAAGNVKEITSQEETIEGELKKEATYTPPGRQGREGHRLQDPGAVVRRPRTTSRAARRAGRRRQRQAARQRPRASGTLLLGFGPTILLVGLFVWLMRGADGGGARRRPRRLRPLDRAPRRKPGDATGSRSTTSPASTRPRTSSSRSSTSSRTRSGTRGSARASRAACCSTARPGTGKTLLARAVAGEADAAFFSISASEFVEAIVGVGASRVRDLFKQAKEAAPSIIFIDELDAIGRSRSGNVGGISGGNDEREQTLNQILTEMDGFEAGTNVIVLGRDEPPGDPRPGAAAPRPLRPAHRRAAARPDRPRRRSSKIHTRSVPLDADVDLEQHRRLDARHDRRRPRAAGQRGGAVRRAPRPRSASSSATSPTRSRRSSSAPSAQVVMTDADRERTAYHESGHALVGMLTPGADPVRKISIIPRGQALGVTLSTPETDRYSYEREDLIGKIKVALGGRAAEKVVYGETDDRRRVRHPEAHADRPRHGRALGDERRDRPDRGRPTAARTACCCPARRRPRSPRSSSSTRRSAGSSRRPSTSHRAARARAQPPRRAWRTRCWSSETLDQPEAYEAAGVPVPPMDPAREARATTDAPVVAETAAEDI